MTILYQFFGGILKTLYEWVGNYGLSIVLFSVFAKVIMIPLNYKQYRSTQLMQMLNPAQQIIQKKYANDKVKQNEELNKLFQRYKYNPLSGCLPLLIQFPIIIGLYGVLRMPVPYVFEQSEFATVSQAFLWMKDMASSPLQLLKSSGFNAEFLLSLIIPIASVVLTIIQQKKTSASTAGSDPSQAKMMSTVMTVMIGYIGFTFNQGLALYWTLQTALGLLQNIIMDKFFPLKVEPPKIVKKGAKTADIK